MTEQTLDPRTKKTKDAILRTFKEMLLEMDLSQITIKKLTDRVGINRKTFYHHYDHIEDLIHDMQDQLVATSIEFLRPSIENKDYYTYFKNNFIFWAKEMDFVHTFYSRKDLTEIYNEFSKKELLANNFEELWPELEHPKYVEAFSFGITNYLFSYWYTNGKPIPLEEFAELGANLIVNGFVGDIKKD